MSTRVVAVIQIVLPTKLSPYHYIYNIAHHKLNSGDEIEIMNTPVHSKVFNHHLVVGNESDEAQTT